MHISASMLNPGGTYKEDDIDDESPGPTIPILSSKPDASNKG